MDSAGVDKGHAVSGSFWAMPESVQCFHGYEETLASWNCPLLPTIDL